LMDLIPVTDLKQWAYCPGVVYYHYVMPAPPKPTYKMKEGLAAQEMIESLEMRRNLREYGLDAARRRFGLWLEDHELGLSGKIDLLLEATEEIAVVDFKLTSGEPGQNHRVQLAAYSMLGESACGRPARRAFLYRIPDNRIFAELVTDDLRLAVKSAVVNIRKMGQSQLCPEPTDVRARCVECEFANYCADFW
jgi:CRISPR-associated exonuclease Cas4